MNLAELQLGDGDLPVRVRPHLEQREAPADVEVQVVARRVAEEGGDAQRRLAGVVAVVVGEEEPVELQARQRDRAFQRPKIVARLVVGLVDAGREAHVEAGAAEGLGADGVVEQAWLPAGAEVEAVEQIEGDLEGAAELVAGPAGRRLCDGRRHDRAGVDVRLVAGRVPVVVAAVGHAQLFAAVDQRGPSRQAVLAFLVFDALQPQSLAGARLGANHGQVVVEVGGVGRRRRQLRLGRGERGPQRQRHEGEGEYSAGCAATKGVAPDAADKREHG